MVIKIVWYWHQKQIHNQWNTVGSSEINVCTYYGQLIYNKGSKNTQWRKDSLFNKLCWGNWTIIFKELKRLKLEYFLIPYQSCPTLWDPKDCSLPGSSVYGIFQARILEWVAISFSRGSSWPRDWSQVSRIVGRRFTVWATWEVQYRIQK